MMQELLRTRAVLAGWVGGPGLMTFYHRHTLTGEAILDAQADAVYARVRTFLAALQAYTATGTTVTLIQQQDVLNEEDGELQRSYVPVGQTAIGTSSGGASYSPATAALIKLSTAGIVHGHAVQGRIFVSPLNAGMVSGGVMIAAAISGLPSITGPLIAGGGTEPKFSVWSRPVKKSTPTIPVRNGRAFAVTAATTPAKIAVLRSRRD